MRRNRRRSPPPRYVPYSPLGTPTNGTFVSSHPPNMAPRPVYTPSPFNPHNQIARPGGAMGYLPPFPRLPTPSELGMGQPGKNRLLPTPSELGMGQPGKNRKVRFVNSRGGGQSHQRRGGRGRGGVANRSNPGHKSHWKPAVNASDRPKPPPPPPLGHFSHAGNSKSVTTCPKKSKQVLSSSYKIPTSPQEELLRLAIISAVKELLRNKKLDKKMFKFVCKHVSLNVFSVLSEKKDISKPEKMIQLRIAKIQKLVDEECERVLQGEKALQQEKNKKTIVDLTAVVDLT